MARIVILGAGVMGAAMAIPARDAGHKVALVGTHLDEAIVRSVRENGRHPRLNVAMPEGVSAHGPDELADVLEAGADLLVLGVSSAGVDWAIERLADSLAAPVPILMITKGLMPSENGIVVLPHHVGQAIAQRTGLAVPVLAVGGPCIAGELAARRHTSVVITGEDGAEPGGEVARAIALLATPYYHARPSADVIGVEFCAAFKNFFALGVGAAAGQLEREGKAANGALMHNHAASAFAQALAELQALVRAAGGDPASVGGLAGAGDLYVTCQAGRNSRMGRLLGLGRTFADAKRDHMPADTVEGAQLALDLGGTLRALFANGTLPAERLPLTRAILASICDNAPFIFAFDAFHCV